MAKDLNVQEIYLQTKSFYNFYTQHLKKIKYASIALKDAAKLTTKVAHKYKDNANANLVKNYIKINLVTDACLIIFFIILLLN